MTPLGDEISAFYDDHPYPPPIEDLEAESAAWADGTRRRERHHLLWPTTSFRDVPTILVAGSGTSQAARYAVRHPRAEVVGIDVSETSIEATRLLAEHHGLTNLELRRSSVEDVAALDRSFDLVVCTGVLHHLADPLRGLRALRAVLAHGGAMVLMVYGAYGRVGVTMLREYCRRLGLTPSAADIADLVQTLRELPLGHPLSPLLRNTRDFHDVDALADALLNPRERAYTVPQLLELVDRADLRFSRWLRQAPYLPQCGALTEVPHGARIAALAPAEQFAAVELFRGTIVRHTAIVHQPDTPFPPGICWDDEAWRSFVPIRPSDVVVVEDRLPPGAAGAVLNRSHSFSDLVVFLSKDERAVFDEVDGRRTMGEISSESHDLFRRLWWHDHLVIDASRAETTPAR